MDRQRTIYRSLSSTPESLERTRKDTVEHADPTHKDPTGLCRCGGVMSSSITADLCSCCEPFSSDSSSRSHQETPPPPSHPTVTSSHQTFTCLMGRARGTGRRASVPSASFSKRRKSQLLNFGSRSWIHFFGRVFTPDLSPVELESSRTFFVHLQEHLY